MVSPYDIGLDKNPANFAPLTPLQFLDWSASACPQRPALLYMDRCFTWAETHARCRRLASALAQRGIGRGDTVAAILWNTPEMFECHFGVPMSGAVLNTINVRLELFWVPTPCIWWKAIHSGEQFPRYEDPIVDEQASCRPQMTTIRLAWAAPNFSAVKGIIHAPSAKPAMRPESRDALLAAIAKARRWIDDIRLGRVVGTLTNWPLRSIWPWKSVIGNELVNGESKFSKIKRSVPAPSELCQNIFFGKFSGSDVTKCDKT